MQIFFSLFLMVFSFCYTNKAVEFIKSKDPIMNEIESNSFNFKVNSVNAYIKNDSIIPGINGLVVDKDKSFNKMKKYGNYNEELLVFEEVSPSININDNYNKYIISGNLNKKMVSLVFSINGNNIDKLKDISRILNNKNTVGSFFVDEYVLNNYSLDVYNLANLDNEIEINYNSYNNLYISNLRDKLNDLINLDGSYCLTLNKNESILNSCANNKMNTIIPSFKVNSFSDVKNNLSYGSIIYINDSSYDELSTIINYIYQRGYVIDILSNLLSENYYTK